MNLFLRISIVLAILAVFGASISGVLHQKARQQKIQEALVQLTSQNHYERANAIDALVELKAKEAIPNIIRLLQDNDQYVSQWVGWALVKLGAKEAIPAITKLLQDTDPEVCQEAVRVLARLGAKEAIPQITILLQDNNPDVRALAVLALVHLGAKEAIPQIIGLLQDTNLAVLESAAWALGQLGAKEAIPDITKLLLNNDKNVAPFIHAPIIYALGQLDARESIPELVKALDHHGGFIRGLTAVVLIEFGIKDKIPAEAIEDIKILLRYYSNNDISARARAALKALGMEVPEEK